MKQKSISILTPLLIAAVATLLAQPGKNPPGSIPNLNAKANASTGSVGTAGPRGTRGEDPSLASLNSNLPSPAEQQTPGRQPDSLKPLLARMASEGREGKSPLLLISAARLSLVVWDQLKAPVDQKAGDLLDAAYALASTSNAAEVKREIADLLSEPNTAITDTAKAAKIRQEPGVSSQLASGTGSTTIPKPPRTPTRSTREIYHTRDFTNWTAVDSRSRRVDLGESIQKGSTTFLGLYIDEPQSTKQALDLHVLLHGYGATGYIRRWTYTSSGWTASGWEGWNGGPGSQISSKLPKGPGYYGVQIFAAQPVQGAQVMVW